jgi:predicted RNase H-like HicB family nuclease
MKEKDGCRSEMAIFAHQTESKMKYTLVITTGQNGFFIGQLKELPAVFTQGKTVDEVKVNIADALEMYLEDVRENYVPQGQMLEETEMSF